MTNRIIRHLTDNDLYTFSVCYLYLKKFPRAWGRYTFVDRNETAYPPGFADKVNQEIRLMRDIRFTEEEREFMAEKCYFLPAWFYTFLQGYRFDPGEVCVTQDAEGRLHIAVEGPLWKTVFWEVPVLAIVSELRHCLLGDMERYDACLEYAKSLAKGQRLIEEGLLFSEFGTRRRFSFDHQDAVVRSFVEANRSRPKAAESFPGNFPGSFVGTSNVYFAMKYDLTPMGTMSHQVISFCGAIFGYKEANFLAMDYWQEAFDSDLGTFLYDTYGWNAFQENFSKMHAKLFDGLRVDSGDNFAAVDKIVAKYKQLGIDPMTKTLTFSNGLNVDEAIAIHRYCQGKIRDNYGIGTHLTNDVAGTQPSNIVIKLTEARLTEKKPWQKAIKLSDDEGKHTGDPAEVDLAMRSLGL